MKPRERPAWWGPRHDNIETILERLEEFMDPQQGPGGVRGDGDSVVSMPQTFTDDVKEVLRLYQEMRRTAGVYGEIPHPISSLHWHMAEWYVRARWVAADVPVRVKRHGKWMNQKNADNTPVTVRSLIRRPHPGAQEKLAWEGIRWVASSWTLRSEPFVPCLCLDRRKGQPHSPACVAARSVAA